MIEVPVRIQGSVLAAESFGAQPTTTARAQLLIDGMFNGQPIGPLEAAVESTSVIPDQASIDQTLMLQVPVNAGLTILSYDLHGRWSLEAGAQATGGFFSIAGSSTAQVDFPNGIRVGNFRGVGGAPLPPWTIVTSMIDGRTYVDESPGLVPCVASQNSTGFAAKLGAQGSPSLALADVTLTATNAPAGQFGIFIFGGAASVTPVGNGFLCVSPGTVGLHRFGAISIGAAGVMSSPLDLTSYPGTVIITGQQLVFQSWFRDPAAGGSMFNFSDSLGLLFVP